MGKTNNSICNFFASRIDKVNNVLRGVGWVEDFHEKIVNLLHFSASIDESYKLWLRRSRNFSFKDTSNTFDG